MSDWSVGQNWEYSRWLKNYARNSRITLPTDILPYAGELTAIRTFIKYIWDPMTQTGTRPWLQAKFQRSAVQVPGDQDYQCDIDQQPAHVLVLLLEVIGKDLKKQPVTAGEVMAVGSMFMVASARVFGSSPTYGNVGGAIVFTP